MYRATTPTHTFIFDVDPEETFKTILISYAQKGEVVVEKGKEDLTVVRKQEADGSYVWEASLQLTQQETKLFDASQLYCSGNMPTPKVVEIQIRALTYENEAVAFDKMTVLLQDVLNDEVLT